MQATTDQAAPEPLTLVKRPHRWQPGESGNPAGRARHVLPDGKSVREHARNATPEALELLTACMRDTQQPMQMRMDAARAILRTGHADSTRESVDDTPKVVVVERLVEANPQPVRGVLNSPIREHVWREPPATVPAERVAQPATLIGENVIEAGHA